MEDTKGKDEVVESWLNAEKATVPDETTKEPAIRDTNIPAGVGMRFHSLTEAGWVYVYHQQTGDRSIINRNMLQQQLLKELPGGKKAFGITPPKDARNNLITPLVGEYKCLLHKDDPDRAYYDRQGFAVCLREGIPSVHAQRQHMAKKHKVEWDTIKEGRKDIEKKEDKDFQRALYTRLAGEKPVEVKEPIEEKRELYVSDKPSKPRKKRKVNK